MCFSQHGPRRERTEGPLQAGSDRSFIERDWAPLIHTHTPCPPHPCLGHCHQAWYSWSTPHPTPPRVFVTVSPSADWNSAKAQIHTHIMCPFPYSSFRKALCLSECIGQVCADRERSTEWKNGERDLCHYLVLARSVCVDIDSIPLEINPLASKPPAPPIPSQV